MPGEGSSPVPGLSRLCRRQPGTVPPYHSSGDRQAGHRRAPAGHTAGRTHHHSQPGRGLSQLEPAPWQWGQGGLDLDWGTQEGSARVLWEQSRTSRPHWGQRILWGGATCSADSPSSGGAINPTQRRPGVWETQSHLNKAQKGNGTPSSTPRERPQGTPAALFQAPLSPVPIKWSQKTKAEARVPRSVSPDQGLVCRQQGTCCRGTKRGGSRVWGLLRPRQRKLEALG